MNELVARLRALSRNKAAVNAATAIGTALIVALLAMYAVDNISFLTSADRFVQDWEIATRSPVEPQDPNILVLAVDDEAMRHFAYRSPLDRAFLSALLEALDAKHPKAIVLDYLFDTPTEKIKDDMLRDTLRGMKTPTVVSYFETDDKDHEKAAYLQYFVPKKMQAAANLGTDQTDTARWIIPEYVTPSGEHLTGVAHKVAALVGAPAPLVQIPIVWRADEGVNKPSFAEIPACVQGALGCRPITAILDEAMFKNKIVLIGSDQTLVDSHRTPFATLPGSSKGSMPGIMIIAYAIAQLIEHRDPPQLSWWNNFLIALLFAGIGGGIALLNYTLWIRAGTVAVLLAVLWGFGVFVLYEHGGILIGLIAPTLSLAVSFAGVDSIAGLDARRQREFIRSSFSRYLPPKFVQQIEDDPSILDNLGGVRRDMSLLFTDIQGFTTMAEGLDPADVGRLLNAYLNGMTAAVQKHDGMVDKYIGDAVFAIWNGLVDVEDYATKAVHCALDMDTFTEKFRTQMKAEGIPLGMTRIGVHAGAAAFGNFGSQVRLSLTASGDAVNAASRLEGLNKTFGTRLCVSDATKVLCHGVVFRPMGSVILKGRTTTLDVWEPLHDGVASEEFLKRYNDAYEALRSDADAAKSLFGRLAADFPDDPLIAFHYERLREGETGVKIEMHEK